MTGDDARARGRNFNRELGRVFRAVFGNVNIVCYRFMEKLEYETIPQSFVGSLRRRFVLPQSIGISAIQWQTDGLSVGVVAANIVCA